jgi:hypothetical protein
LLPGRAVFGGQSQRQGRIETFEINDFGLAQFFKTLTADTHVLIDATITTFSFARLFKDRVKSDF